MQNSKCLKTLESKMWKSCGFFLTSKGHESAEIVLSGQKFALSLLPSLSSMHKTIKMSQYESL